MRRTWLVVIALACAACGGTSASSTIPAPSASPAESTDAPIASASAALGCQTSQPSCTGPLVAGTHRSAAFRMPFTYAVPDGWKKNLDLPTAFNLSMTDEPSSFLGMWPDFAASTKAACAKSAAPGVGRTAADLVVWLADHPGLVTTEPIATSIGGFDGQLLTVESDPAWNNPCTGKVSVFVATADDVGWLPVWDGLRVDIAVVDTGDGHTLTVWVEADKVAYESFRSAAAPVVESFDFTP